MVLGFEQTSFSTPSAPSSVSGRTADTFRKSYSTFNGVSVASPVPSGACLKRNQSDRPWVTDHLNLMALLGAYASFDRLLRLAGAVARSGHWTASGRRASGPQRPSGSQPLFRLGLAISGAHKLGPSRVPCPWCKCLWFGSSWWLVEWWGWWGEDVRARTHQTVS